MTDGGSVSAADLGFVRQLLYERAGFVLEDDKGYLVETRLSPLARACGTASIAALVDRLRREANEQLRQDAVEAMLNGETSFFRDLACFDALRRVVLPSLLDAKRSTRELSIWCAACSTGQEPYSLAMLLDEAFPELADWNVTLLATDVSETHLSRARSGRYAQFEVNRGLPAAMLVKHFDQHGQEWRVSSSLRRRVTFSRLNLIASAWPAMPTFDLVLLRNVMIYWTQETKREVLARVRALMHHGSVLVLGGAETTYYVDEHFDRVAADVACCFRLTSA